jgi:hypothetical protein
VTEAKLGLDSGFHFLDLTRGIIAGRRCNGMRRGHVFEPFLFTVLVLAS